jgi:hypothetical protein
MAPALGGVAHGPVNALPRAERPRRAYAAVEAMAGGAQDDDFFLTSSHGGLLGYTPPLARFSWRGGIAHGSVNTLPRAERARTAHRQKKEP